MAAVKSVRSVLSVRSLREPDRTDKGRRTNRTQIGRKPDNKPDTTGHDFNGSKAPMLDIDETQEINGDCNPAVILEAAKELNVPAHHIRPLAWYVTGFNLHFTNGREGPAHRFYLMAEREAEAIAVIYG